MIGSVVGGFRLVSELGSGGMGTVYLGEADGTGSAARRVAVKVVHPHLVGRDDFFQRFLREAEIGKRVQHENVVRTLDAGGEVLGDRQLYFIVMEYVEGQTLRALLAELSRVPEDLCRHVGREIASALDAIHSAGVVHRDLKPENVLLSRGEIVKVMDLGIARLQDAAFQLSQTGQFVGSLHYAAPEQFRDGGRIDGRADLYSLGLVLYELATGVHPFHDEDFRVVMRRQLSEEPRRPATLHACLSPFFDALVTQLLSKTPDARFPSASDLLDALQNGEESTWWRARARALGAPRPGVAWKPPPTYESGFHGREPELASLRALFERARNGHGQAVLIEGEAGVGRTRLVEEFAALLRREGEDVHHLAGGFPPGGAATASGAFTAAYREHFLCEAENRTAVATGIGRGAGSPCGSPAGADTVDTPTRCDALDAMLGRVLPATPGLVPSFAALLRGEPPAPGSEPLSRDSLQTLFVHVTRALAAEKPTVVLADDLHFAPDEGRALFAALAMALPGHRILLIGTSRPGLPAQWVTDLDRLEHVSRLRVPRLREVAVARIVRDVLCSDDVPSGLADEITTRSDGNPFFALETLHALKDANVLVRRADGGWTASTSLRDFPLPSTLRDVLLARLDGLDAEDRDLLEMAACCGHEFDPVLVGEALGAPRVPFLKRLGRLEQTRRVIRAAGRRWVFDHPQIAETLRETMPELLREEYHASLAAALETRERAAGRDPERAGGEAAVDLARHLLLARRPDDAKRFLASALAHLESGASHAAAADLCARMLALDASLSPTARFDLLLRRATHLELLGRKEEEQTVLDEALRLADGGGDLSARARVRSQLGEHLCTQGRVAAAREVLDDALSLARRAGDRREEARAAAWLGRVFHSLSRHPEAAAHAALAAETAREVGDVRLEAFATGALALASRGLGRYAEARDHGERALALARQVADRRGERIAAWTLAYVYFAFGMYDRAREHAESALELSREVGDLRGIALAHALLGLICHALGLNAQAHDNLERAIVRLRETQFRLGEAIALVHQGRLFRSEQRLRIAVRAFRQAARVAQEIDAPEPTVLAAAYLASLGEVPIESAIAAYVQQHERVDPATRLEARFVLWQATKDPAHLEEARREGMHLLEHAPPEVRETMAANVPLLAAVLQADTKPGASGGTGGTG